MDVHLLSVVRIVEQDISLDFIYIGMKFYPALKPNKILINHHCRQIENDSEDILFIIESNYGAINKRKYAQILPII